MKLFKHLLALLIIFALIQTKASAVENNRINWYYKTDSQNSRPQILQGTKVKGLEKSLYLGPEDDKTVYLTFDAGYSNENLITILDVLKERNIKAAFFILPGIIKNSPETVIRMAEEGHLVCNHTTTHGDMSKIKSIEELKKELSGVEQDYFNLTGKEMEKYFRPPEGAFSEKTLEFCSDLGYTPVFWSFAYADWDKNKQPDTEYAKNKILSNAHNGMVILLHPTSKTNAEIFDDVLTDFENMGYSFGTLHQLKEKVGI